MFAARNIKNGAAEKTDSIGLDPGWKRLKLTPDNLISTVWD
jgi:hypothetical protein